MDSNTLIVNRIGFIEPHDYIDTDWISQRIQERGTVRRSKLASYFDGFMEFTGRPPPLSRSPSPDISETPSWQVDHLAAQFRASSSNQRDVKWGAGKGAPRIPTRRSTQESDSDPGYSHHDIKRRHMTPITRPEVEHRIAHSRKSKQTSRRTNDKAPETQSSHAMKTRSKSRGKRSTRRSRISKSGSQRRKLT